MSKTRDEVAEELFEDQYHRLSAWGRRKVDEALSVRVAPEPVDGLPKEPESATLLKDNEHLARQLANAQQENIDLWDEVTDLKTQLAELRAELNLPPSM